MGPDGRGLSQARFGMVEVKLEKDKFGVQGVPECRALVALHSGEVVRCRHLSGDPVPGGPDLKPPTPAPAPWT